MTKIEELIQEAERLKNERRSEQDKWAQVDIWDKELRVLMELKRTGYMGEGTTKTRSEKYASFIKVADRPPYFPWQDATLYFFPNGYGASVIYGVGTYGLEVQVQRMVYGSFRPAYDTPLTDDVIGDIEDLDEVLEQIKNL